MRNIIKKIFGAFVSNKPDWTDRCGGCLFANSIKTYCYKHHKRICYYDRKCAEYREYR